MQSATAGAAQPPRTARSRRWCVPLLLLVGGACYLSSFNGTFLFDDENTIVRNPLLSLRADSWRQLLEQPRWLVTGSFTVNHLLGGLDVWGYHAVNLLIHLLAGLTLFDLVRRTLLLPGLSGRFGHAASELALCVALIWLVHPLQTESVTYLSQRAESLMGLFYFLTIYCLLRGTTSSRPRSWHVVAVVVCALGMGSKEVMVTAPLLAVLYDRAFLSPSWRAVLRRRWGLYIGLAATWCLLAGPVQLALISPPGPATARAPQRTAGFAMPDLRPLPYALSQPAVILHYLRLSVWPDRLCLDYGWPVARTTAEMVPGVLIVGALLLATMWAWRRCPPLGFVGAWFFLILAPTSSFMPIADLTVEHRMYLPLAAVVVLGVLGMHGLLAAVGRRPGADPRLEAWLRPGLAAGVVLALGLVTSIRNGDYASDLRMWSDVVEQRPSNPRGHTNLAAAYLVRGQLAEALRHYQEGVRLRPGDALAHHNLGRVLQEQGATEEACAEYRKALHLDPALAESHLNLGHLLMAQGHLTQAVGELREAMRLKPEDPLGPLNLGMALQFQEDWAEAAVAYRRAIALQPGSAAGHRGLAFVLGRRGQTAEAQREYEQALHLDPRWPAAALREAWDRATNPHAGRRNGTVAVQLAQQVVEAAGETEPQVLDVLAAAYAEAGRFPDAIETGRKALELAGARGRSDLAAAIQQRLRGYENNQPFRSGPGIRREGGELLGGRVGCRGEAQSRRQRVHPQFRIQKGMAGQPEEHLGRRPLPLLELADLVVNEQVVALRPGQPLGVDLGHVLGDPLPASAEFLKGPAGVVAVNVNDRGDRLRPDLHAFKKPWVLQPE
jgi:tetratricopeptide (TPR) repeat protein